MALQVNVTKPPVGLTFPKDLINGSSNRNYYMTLSFLEYQRRSIFNQPFLKPSGDIRLPIPNNLTDSQDVGYTFQGAEPAVGAAIESTINALGNERVQFNSSGLTKAGTQIAGSAGSIGGSIATGMGVGAINNLATKAGIPLGQAGQLAGVAQNPFMTVLFEKPEFKSHSFSWKLSPSNYQESQTLRNIINSIRSAMLPSITPSSAGTLLNYPMMVQVNLYPNDDYLYKFKPGVIRNMTVNFAPGNTPAFFKGTNAPTEVTLSITIQEIEYWLQEDVSTGGNARASGVGIDLLNFLR